MNWWTLVYLHSVEMVDSERGEERELLTKSLRERLKRQKWNQAKTDPWKPWLWIEEWRIMSWAVSRGGGKIKKQENRIRAFEFSKKVIIYFCQNNLAWTERAKSTMEYIKKRIFRKKTETLRAELCVSLSNTHFKLTFTVMMQILHDSGHIWQWELEVGPLPVL